MLRSLLSSICCSNMFEAPFSAVSMVYLIVCIIVAWLITNLNSELFIPHRIEIVVNHRCLCNSSVAQSNIHKRVGHILRGGSRLKKSHFSFVSLSHLPTVSSLLFLFFSFSPYLSSFFSHLNNVNLRYYQNLLVVQPADPALHIGDVFGCLHLQERTLDIRTILTIAWK